MLTAHQTSYDFFLLMKYKEGKGITRGKKRAKLNGCNRGQHSVCDVVREESTRSGLLYFTNYFALPVTHETASHQPVIVYPRAPRA